MERCIIAELQPQIEEFPAIVKNAKKLKGATNQDIADATGIPISNINKFMSGNLAIPNLYNAAATCKYLDISLDECFGLEQKDLGSVQEYEIKALERELEYAKKDNEHLMQSLRSRKMIITVLFGICVLMIASFGFGIVYDAIRPTDGFIQGSHIAGISITLITVIVVAIAATVSLLAITFKSHE